MIQLEHIHIEEFRGIRSIDLPLGSKSFVVHGPNGSGKSGVVDAIDFVLTGNIGRLAGAGTGGVTLLKHGPHVHQRDNPAAATVALTVKDSETGAKAILTRSVKDPTRLQLDPDTPEMRAAVTFAQIHPELTLSRREIIKYVVSKPADRAQEIQALLKLEKLDQFRRLLRTSLTKASSELKVADAELKTAEQSIMGHLDISSLLVPEVAREINTRRQTLGLAELTEVTIETNFLEGLTAGAVARGVNLETALKEVSGLNKELASLDDITDKQRALTNALDDLAADPELLDTLQHRLLVEQGIRLLQSNHCPLCDNEWPDIEELRKHLQGKLDRLEAARALQQRINLAGQEYKTKVNFLKGQADNIMSAAEAYGDDELPQLLKSWRDGLLAHVQNLASLDAMVLARPTLSSQVYAAPANVITKLAALEARIIAEPNQTATDAARTFLTVAKERWTRVRLARALQTKAAATRSTAQEIYDSYCSAMDKSLDDLYQVVESDFSSYYQRINADDEGAFKAALKPTAGSLELSVDFYGLGMFPPTAYHSEGHQDGMGICLYLALVKQLLGADFRYAVLDDVVMSVDVNHRQQFCKLLKSEFPNVQFIITTHDEVWARQMQSAGLITSKAQARFYGWTVDGGPVYEQGDVWDRIEEDLHRNEVPAAAHKLRRRLEAASADIAESIGGRVVFRGDANYDLSELLSAVKGRYTTLLKMATISADSWNNDVARQAAVDRKSKRSAVYSEQEAESWIVNTLVHNNDWADTSVEDFRPVLEATRAFLELFTCDNPECGSWVYVIGRPEEELRCSCGLYSLNLRKK
jgi:recombinational DNA repair ATPase RecF